MSDDAAAGKAAPEADTGNAAVGNAAVGKAAVGKATVGNAAVGKAAVGKVAAEKPLIDLEADDLTQYLGWELGKFPGQEPVTDDGYATLKGYLVGSEHDKHLRIYLNASGLFWLKICTDDIKFRQKAPAHERDQRSTFWVPRRAKVIKCGVSYAQDVEDVVSASDPGGGPNTGTWPY